MSLNWTSEGPTLKLSHGNFYAEITPSDNGYRWELWENGRKIKAGGHSLQKDCTKEVEQLIGAVPVVVAVEEPRFQEDKPLPKYHAAGDGDDE